MYDYDTASKMPVENNLKLLHWGPFKGYSSEHFDACEIYLSEDTLKIEDGKWNMPGIETARERSYAKIHDYKFNTGVKRGQETMFKIYMTLSSKNK